MASTIDIRRRIRSVKNTQQITKAMKMVSAAKLRRAQERMFAARPYSAALRQVLSSVATRVEVLPIGRKANDFFRRRPIPIRREATQVFQALSLETAQEIAKTIVDDFMS